MILGRGGVRTGTQQPLRTVRGPRHLRLSDGRAHRLVFPVDVVFLALHFLKVELRPGHPLVDVLDVVTGGLEVSGRVVGAGNKDLK